MGRESSSPAPVSGAVDLVRGELGEIPSGGIADAVAATFLRGLRPAQ